MRTSLKMLPIALLLSSMPAMAQDAPPRVLFCSGPCFAVDARGVRTPAPKGTVLQPGQRLETGAGGYAQLRLGRDAAIGVGDQARVRFEGNAVTLDQGRVRVLNGQALGRPDARPTELRTGDGNLVLRSADVEVKKTTGPQAGPVPTVMKVNAGDATLRGIQGDVAVPKDAVQGISKGQLTTGPTLTVTETRPVPGPATGPRSPAPLPVAAVPTLRGPIGAPMPALQPIVVVQPALTPVVSISTRILTEPVLDTSTGTTTTLTQAIKTTSSTPTTTTSTKTLIAPTTITTTTIRR